MPLNGVHCKALLYYTSLHHLDIMSHCDAMSIPPESIIEAKVVAYLDTTLFDF